MARADGGDTFTLYAPADPVCELAQACMVGLCANIEAPHHKPREMAKRAFDCAQAFYDELDARVEAAQAAEVSDTEPPPAAPLLTPDVLPDELDEDPAPESVPAFDSHEAPGNAPITADNPYKADDLARASSPTV